jgi:hypothetical protein
MATKQYYATGSFKYGTRMMRAGDPVELDAPSARLFTALGKISPDKPRTITSMARPDADGSGNLVPSTPAAPKRAPRKRAAKKK